MSDKIVVRQTTTRTVQVRVVGPPGPQGDPGADGLGFEWQGAWDVGTTYSASEVVSHEGSSWLATAETTGDEPGVEAVWEVVAEKGADGVGAEGVPTGGSAGQVLVKDSGTDFDTSWVNAAPVIVNAQTDSYSLVLADAGKLVEMGKGTAQDLTVPLNSSQAFPVGTRIDIVQTGAGQVTVVATGGVTVNAKEGLKLTGQWAAATLIKRATDTWVLIGALES